MDTLAAITAFVRVVDSGSFAAAARSVGQSRSQINRQVIELEDSLGVSLLTRTTRSLSLTPTGQAFYPRCRALLEDLSEALNEVRADHGRPEGPIKINAPMSFGTLRLGPAIADFMRLYPKVLVHLTLSDRFVDPLTEGFDVTVRISEAVPPAAALIDHDVCGVARRLCAAPTLLARVGLPSSVEDLATMPCLHYGDLPNGGSWQLHGPDGSHEMKVAGVMCSNNAEVLCQAAEAGLGIALLPDFIAQDALAAGRLVPVLPEYSAPELRLWLIYPANRHLSARMRSFVQFMQGRFAASDSYLAPR